MTDYNWFSSGAIQVATEGLRAEAKKWYGLSQRMDVVSSNAANQALSVAAFVVTDLTGGVTAVDLKSGYDKMHDWITSLFKQAAVEFDSMGDALKKNADWYERADADSVQRFDSIASS